jgi:hypothetical protein
MRRDVRPDDVAVVVDLLAARGVGECPDDQEAASRG